MSAFTFLVLLLAGGVAGLITSLVGVGGSMVTIPLLLLLLPEMGVHAAVLPATALATTMAVSLCTSLMSTWAHWKAGNLVQPFESAKFVLMAAVGVGAGIGVSLAASVPEKLLLSVMCVSQAVFAVLLFRGPRAPARPAAPPPGEFKPGFFSAAYFGLVGFLASIGAGGTLIVPYLTLRGMPQKEAIANAAWLGLSVGLVGLTLFALHAPAHSPGQGALGFVYLPVAAALIAGSAIAVRSGAALARKLDPRLLRRLLAAGLVLSSLRLALKLL